MFLIFIAILVLAAIGLVSVLGAAAGAFFKGLFILLLAGVLFSKVLWLSGRGGRHFDHRHHWDRSRRRNISSKEGSQEKRQEKFEEWHRMAHAREEVDSWVPEV